MVNIKVCIGDNQQAFKLDNVSKQQAVDVIEVIEIALAKMFGLIDQTMMMNCHDASTNEPVTCSGLIGTPFNYYIVIE